TGQGIYAEPVEDADQTLDDAEIFYATVGSLTLLQIKPFKERDFRILVFNEKTREVRRIDSIRHSCVLLPEDHGIIFSDGYYLQTGETKIFDSELSDMYFDRRIASSNGEDFLFVFYNRRSGDYVLMPYNIIAQTVETPILCKGYSVFEDGELLYFREEAQPQKHHTIQVWQTPYTGENLSVDKESDSYLFKIGNADIVRCMSECQEVLGLLGKDDSYADLYVDLVKKSGDIRDSFFWVGRPEAHDLAAPLQEIRNAAAAAIDEFEKVQQLRTSAESRMSEVGEKVRKAVSAAEHNRPDDILGFVHNLADLRSVRGEVVTLQDVRYVEALRMEAMEEELVGASEKLSEALVEFMLKPEALDPYRKQVDDQRDRIPKLQKVVEANEVEESLGTAGGELEMLIDIVGNLKIEDATQTTRIIDDISAIYSVLNQVRSELRDHRRSLGRAEAVAQFGAQVKLLDQSVINYFDLCSTPDKCDEYLNKVMVQLEELEAKFADYDEYVEQLGEKREEIYDSFETKKQQLHEEKNRRASGLQKSADRILNGIQHRLQSFEAVEEIHAYLAGDLMIEKVRGIVEDLRTMGESVKADDLRTRLSVLRDEAVRQLVDRQELYVDGQGVIKFGKHRFSVNSQELELSLVQRDDGIYYHLNGTAFFEKIDDERLEASREIWEQALVSENDEVYRAEYLAWKFLPRAMEMEEGQEMAGALSRFAANRYNEGYVKGVHDADAVKFLEGILPMRRGIGTLRYSPEVRTLAILNWFGDIEGAEKGLLEAEIQARGSLRAAVGSISANESLLDRLSMALGEENAERSRAAAEYLVEELTKDGGFVCSTAAAFVLSKFENALSTRRLRGALEEVLEPLPIHGVRRYEVVRDWMKGLVELDEGLEEAAAHWVCGTERYTPEVITSVDIEGLLGAHPRMGEEKSLPLDYVEFAGRLQRYEREVVPQFEAFHALKSDLAEEKRMDLRLEEFKPTVMSAFVRNRLLNDVYLPMIGDNLAKQLGTAGDTSRTDRMGLLLLVSPPGYGKTTLMEYVANRLGITFVKVNGPAIGHAVTSLDPADAPNASAREEIEKLNLSFEMGDNIMIYLDDIQHCHPEFLQKFISLCDGQRKIEGVYNGVARTYDLKGKKVAVVMAGNPYTESGGKFQIPDMLANRADTYNLGDIIGGHAEAFKASYIENTLTSNESLRRLAGRAQGDVYAIMQAAEQAVAGVTPAPPNLEGNYSPAEIDEMVNVVGKLLGVRDTILRVNLEYIRSAAQQDEYRTEPAFKLQGSYRNMNRIAEKIVPLMTEEEVRTIVVDHYENESQTLTTGAEANLLKFKEMEGLHSTEEAERWEEIKKTFQRNQLLGGGGESDPVSRVVGAMGAFSKGLDDIRETISSAGVSFAQPQMLADATIEQLERIIAGLRAVPVDVDINVLPVEQAAPGAAKKASKDLPVDIESDVEQGTERFE
ncbi:MAG: DNA repair ATPase, partial [Verrucomicrobiota bacterium]